jgi:hypothetical protein
MNCLTLATYHFFNQSIHGELSPVYLEFDLSTESLTYKFSTIFIEFVLHLLILKVRQGRQEVPLEPLPIRQGFLRKKDWKGYFLTCWKSSLKNFFKLQFIEQGNLINWASGHLHLNWVFWNLLWDARTEDKRE